MGVLSFLNKEIAIDLGTANTIIIYNDKVVVDEPSIVAMQRDTKKIIAVGKRAMMMHGKTHENIKTIRPLRDGVIADFQAAEYMMREMIKMINFKNTLFPPSLKMVICIPSGITEVEERAVKDSAEQAGAKEVRLIHEPMAAAIGIGIDVLEPTGNMIIDIGGGTSEIAVIALGGIVNNKSIRIAGDDFTADIEEYMRKQHNIIVGERTAERIKIEVGAAIPQLDNPPDDYAVQGRDQLCRDCPLPRQEHHEDRDRRAERLGADPARAVGRHLPYGYLPHRWWCLAAWPRQASQRQDQAAHPRRRRPVARRRPWHRHRPEEL